MGHRVAGAASWWAASGWGRPFVLRWECMGMGCGCLCQLCPFDCLMCLQSAAVELSGCQDLWIMMLHYQNRALALPCSYPGPFSHPSLPLPFLALTLSHPHTSFPSPLPFLALTLSHIALRSPHRCPSSPSPLPFPPSLFALTLPRPWPLCTTRSWCPTCLRRRWSATPTATAATRASSPTPR